MADKPKRGAKDPLRRAAVEVLQRVAEGASLSELLPATQAALPVQQRAKLAEYAYGTLRWQPRIDAFLAQLLDRPLPRKERATQALLRCACYELLYMRTPEHAAVSAWVEVVRSLHRKGKGPKLDGLVNAVLRRLQREQDEIESQIAPDSMARTAHPQWLIEDLRRDWPAQWEAICAANNERPPMTLRVDLSRGSREEALAKLVDAGIEAAPQPHSPAGIQLASPQSVDNLPGFAEGKISVQDAAAQQAAVLLDPQPGERVLDACAAPGGKTLHLLEQQPEVAELLALDVDEERLDRVAENLERAGRSASLAACDAGEVDEWWDGRPFDRILLDAPCSGMGVVRRHPDIKLLRRRGDIASLAERQQVLLQQLWRVLKPGGRLLYATCSVFKAENERQIASFLESQPDARELPIAAGWGEARPHGRQILPGEAGMDGFYYALLQKSDNCG